MIDEVRNKATQGWDDKRVMDAIDRLSVSVDSVRLERATDVEDSRFDAALAVVKNNIEFKLYDPVPVGYYGHGTRVALRATMIDDTGKEHGVEYEIVRGKGETIGRCVDKCGVLLLRSVEAAHAKEHGIVGVGDEVGA